MASDDIAQGRLAVVTGGAGFIGTNLVEELLRRDRAVVVIEDLAAPQVTSNLGHLNVHEIVDWTVAFDWLGAHAGEVASVFHLGAISSTTANDLDLLLKKNVQFSIALWDWCAARGKPLLYASSAATYGDGGLGFSDAMTLDALKALEPLNAYGRSKQIVDLHILRAAASGAPQPPGWYGAKFFNVYGPHERHKGDMRSVALKLYETVTAERTIELFRSYRPEFADGMQLRDFIHVGDCVDVMLWLMAQRPASGLYNIGTGRAESFLAIANTVIAETGARNEVRFIDMPEAIRERYQYFTQADMGKLRAAGYNGSFRSVAEGVADYVRALAAT
jgi:ADP-L-glycero-D-manno-heptose 6-epimerase